jgi:hypothetical protein
VEQCNKREQVLCVWGCGYVSGVGVGVGLGLDPVELVMMEVGMELPVSGKAQCPSLLLGPSLAATVNGVWFVVATVEKKSQWLTQPNSI